MPRPRQDPMLAQIRRFITAAKKGDEDAEAHVRRIAATSTKPGLKALAQEGVDALDQAYANAQAKQNKRRNTPRQRRGNPRTTNRE